MHLHNDRWVARLRPTGTKTIDDLLGLSLGLDIWERHLDYLVVAAGVHQLDEIERRQLALVERLYTLEEYLTRTTEGDDLESS